jgi:hypothetical protein
MSNIKNDYSNTSSDTENDLIIAAALQDEINRVDPAPRVYYQSQIYEPSDYVEEQPLIGRPATSSNDTKREDELNDTRWLSLIIIVISFIDIFLLLLLILIDYLYLFLCWGPIFGFCGGKYFEPIYMYFYIVYYIIRCVGDTLMTLRGNWVSIIVLFLDALILGFIILFTVRISGLTKSEKKKLIASLSNN